MNAKDILKYEHELKEAGVPANQAEIHAKNMADLIDNNLATKQDVSSFRQQINEEFTDVKKDIYSLRRDLKDLENRVTIKIGGMFAVAIAVLLGFQKFLGH